MRQSDAAPAIAGSAAAMNEADMTDLKRACWCAAISLTLIAATPAVTAAATAAGGYNDMDIATVYHDNGRDRVNAAAMLIALANSSVVCRHGYWDSGHRWHHNPDQVCH